MATLNTHSKNGRSAAAAMRKSRKLPSNFNLTYAMMLQVYELNRKMMSKKPLKYSPLYSKPAIKFEDMPPAKQHSFWYNWFFSWFNKEAGHSIA